MAGPAFWCVVPAGSTSCLGVCVLELFSTFSPPCSVTCLKLIANRMLANVVLAAAELQVAG